MAGCWARGLEGGLAEWPSGLVRWGRCADALEV